MEKLNANVKQETKEKFYKCLSTSQMELSDPNWEYTKSHAKAPLRCKKCGWEQETVVKNFIKGTRCWRCGHEATKAKLAEQKGSKFKRLVEASNGEYEIVGQYVNERTPVLCHHKRCGRDFKRVPMTSNSENFTGELCTLCSKEAEALKKTYTIEQANARLKQTNPEYQFVEYYGAQNTATVKHLVCGGTFKDKASYFILGNGHCPYCTTNISKEEREIYNWVKSVCPDAVQSDRTVLNGKELDIYIPSKKVAIEFNGHYWHSFQNLRKRMSDKEAKNYHRQKSLDCAKKGVRLIHIWDYEWSDPRKQAVLKNIVLGATQSLVKRVYARKTSVYRYDNEDARWDEINAFFAKNNIQGNRGGKFVYTLEDADRNILMAYKFGRPSGGSAKLRYQFEMVRGASAPEVQVIGGATKLWKHFIEQEDPESVVYYIDFNYFNGNSVEKIGLHYIGGQAGVRNYWVKTGEVKNREPARHREVMKEIREGNVLELWNAGVQTYVYKKNGLYN